MNLNLYFRLCRLYFCLLIIYSQCCSLKMAPDNVDLFELQRLSWMGLWAGCLGPPWTSSPLSGTGVQFSIISACDTSCTLTVPPSAEPLKLVMPSSLTSSISSSYLWLILGDDEMKCIKACEKWKYIFILY